MSEPDDLTQAARRIAEQIYYATFLISSIREFLGMAVPIIRAALEAERERSANTWIDHETQMARHTERYELGLRGEVERLERRVAELCEAHEEQKIRAEAAERELARLRAEPENS